MNPISVMHTADLHLGATLSSLGDFAGSRRAEIVRTFYRMLDVCRDEHVSVLLIAGDFLEASTIRPAMLSDIIRHMAAVPDVQICIAPGNHDFLAPDSPYETATWPPNVHIFGPAFSRVAVGDALVVYGAAFTGTYQHTSLLRDVDWRRERQETEGRVRVLLIHGDWQIRDSAYHPLFPEDLPSDFFTYVALGHVHKRSPLQQLGRTTLAYPGSPDGAGFDETGERGVYLGTLLPFETHLTFRPFSSRLLWRLDADMTDVTGIDEAAKRILEPMRTPGYALSDMMARVTLVGDAAEDDPLDLPLLQKALEEELTAITLRDRRRVSVDWPTLAREESLRGYFAKALYERYVKADDDQKPIVERALRWGLDTFNGKEVDRAH
ncbi:MAG: DNA repair exonuclease [Peptoniphilaceae bacterium]|nr:DNA repair exonuclease [Peptoniphilaceae bacterium]MDY6085907.1 DNA repair exonuclease [Peptoniphilaceae bacterium]